MLSIAELRVPSNLQGLSSNSGLAEMFYYRGKRNLLIKPHAQDELWPSRAPFLTYG